MRELQMFYLQNVLLIVFSFYEFIIFLANGNGEDLLMDKILVILNLNSVISWEFIPVDNLIDLF